MKKSRTTISDLARSLDLSICTVSKVLNRSFDGFSYAPKTIARVEDAARRMGYRPNPQAQSLRTRRSRLIGFVLPTPEIAMFGSLTARLELALRDYGYQVLIAHSQNRPEEEADIIPKLLDRGVDGVVWIPSTAKVDLAKMGLRADFPGVILDRSGCTTEMPYVATENRKAAGELAQRVRDAGHVQGVVLNAPANDRSMSERLKGLQDVFKTGLTVVNATNDIEAGRLAIADVLSKKVEMSVLFALSEPLAIGALEALRDGGMRIPRDVSFAAFDDFLLASRWDPPLTVVRQDIEALAKATADLVVRRIAKPKKTFEPIRVDAAVVWRDSVIAKA